RTAWQTAAGRSPGALGERAGLSPRGDRRPDPAPEVAARGPGQPDHDRGGAAEAGEVPPYGVAEPAEHAGGERPRGVAHLARQPVLGADALRDERLRQALGEASRPEVGEARALGGHLVLDHRGGLEQDDRTGAPLGDPDAQLRLLAAEGTAGPAAHAPPDVR